MSVFMSSGAYMPQYGEAVGYYPGTSYAQPAYVPSDYYNQFYRHSTYPFNSNVLSVRLIRTGMIHLPMPQER